MPPRLSEAEIDKLRVLYEHSQLSVPALTRETGHSHRTIYWYASRSGWQPRSGGRKPRLPRGEIRALYEDTIVPVAEIARLAGVAVPTIHVWAARDGWKPRSTRLRRKGAPAGGISDLAAEVASARRRAAHEQELRSVRAIGRNLHSLAQIARDESRRLRRAARERAKKQGGVDESLPISPQELAARLDRMVRMRLPDPPAPLPGLPSHRPDESE